VTVTAARVLACEIPPKRAGERDASYASDLVVVFRSRTIDVAERGWTLPSEGARYETAPTQS
jgi:hypothetical protein